MRVSLKLNLDQSCLATTFFIEAVKAREEVEFLLEEVAISETTNLESALENLKIQVGVVALFDIAC